MSMQPMQAAGMNVANLAVAPMSTQTSPAQVNMIAAFIRRRLSGARSGKVTQFVLGHETSDGEGGGTAIDTHPLDPKLPVENIESFAQELAKDMHDHAIEHVACYRAMQRYVVCAYDKKDIVSKVTFVCYPPMGNTMGGETEAPTNTGLTAMSMRFADISLRLAMSQSAQTIERLQNELNDKERRIAEHETRREELYMRLEELRSKHHERELEQNAAKRLDMLATRLFTQVEVLLPHILARFGVQVPAGESIAAPTNAEKEPGKAVLYLYTTLSEEQQRTIIGCLTDDQRNLFLSAMKGFAAAHQAEKGAS